jgi:hypothetical protein
MTSDSDFVEYLKGIWRETPMKREDLERLAQEFGFTLEFDGKRNGITHILARFQDHIFSYGLWITMRFVTDESHRRSFQRMLDSVKETDAYHARCADLVRRARSGEQAARETLLAECIDIRQGLFQRLPELSRPFVFQDTCRVLRSRLDEALLAPNPYAALWQFACEEVQRHT